MRVIGTAGHVDHGKSTLVRKLTGIDPDRLAEEKAREMTIDLGFAWLKLPNQETVGIVDVPGHRDFIENMLAGVGGIDAALLVIAADEGVMPQTREHLAILDLLGIQHGLIVLTKTDAVDDPDWLDLIEQEISDLTKGTTLANAAFARVSALRGEGIDALVSQLTDLLRDMPPRADYKHPRLPIDRVFTISGFGTVVTGTLLGGGLRVGDEIEVQPTGLRGRIRGLQSYKQSVESAEVGSRVAVNVAGLERQAIERGHVLAYAGQLQPTSLIDVRFRYLRDVGRPLKHDALVKFFAGAAESLAHVRLLNDETLTPGAEGWLQIRLDKPLALAQGDRFILRYPSPSQTIGGGVIVNPSPVRRWRRFQVDVIHDLETRMLGTPAQRVAQAANGMEPSKQVHLQKQTGYADAELDTAISEALADGLMVELQAGLYFSAEAFQGLLQRMISELRVFHAAQALRIGMSREALRAKAGLKSATFNAILEMQTAIAADGNVVRLTEHSIRFSDEQHIKVDGLREKLNAAPYTPPSFTEAAELVGEDVLYALMDLGEIVRVQPDVILTAAVYQEMVDTTFAIIDQEGSITASALRDRFNTTRKYVIGLLEHLDSLGLTTRVGDGRIRGSRRL